MDLSQKGAIANAAPWVIEGTATPGAGFRILR